MIEDLIDAGANPAIKAAEAFETIGKPLGEYYCIHYDKSELLDSHESKRN